MTDLRAKFGRRGFLASAGALALCRTVRTEATPIALATGGRETVTVPADFLGLSYETPQLYNPAYFAPSNRALVAEFRAISSRGVLRFGGSLSAYTRWRRPGGDFSSDKENRAVAAQHNWEWKLLDPGSVGAQDGAITPRALHALRGFLDATGWRCIYGLNFGSGTIARAVDEADNVLRFLGNRLLCFQLGNEPDFWAGNPLLRSNPYPFEQYKHEYESFVKAIRARHPRAPFAGPDVAQNLDWVAHYAESECGNALFASGHHYAMGPASDPAMTAERLLAPVDPRLEQQIAAVTAMTERTGMRFRLTEANSCFGGGKPGVSDAYASALWGVDFLLTTACAGYLGVDLHGGGAGYYTPIEAGTEGPVRRPLFHAMRFAAHFVGAPIRRGRFATDANASLFVSKRRSETLIGLVNKSAVPINFDTEATFGPNRRSRKALILHAPSLADRTGTSLEPWPISHTRNLTVPAFSAMLVRAR
ncbi:MAG: hypothetical protein ABIQ66_02200 [Novosphingobium sp.]